MRKDILERMKLIRKEKEEPNYSDYSIIEASGKASYAVLCCTALFELTQL